MRVGGIIFVIYLVIGIIVAANQGYLSGLGNLMSILEALVAVLIWPLLLLGVDFNFSGVEGGGGGNAGGA